LSSLLQKVKQPTSGLAVEHKDDLTTKTYVTQGPKTRHLSYLAIFLIIFYTASASKYFFQNENVLFLTEVILV